MKYTDLPWYRDALAAKSKPEEEEGILGFLGNNLAAGTGQLISDLGGLHERYARHGRDAEEWHNAPENWGRDWQDYGQEMYERNARDYEPGTANYYLAQALQSTPSTIALGLAGWGAGAAAGSVVPGVGNLVGGAVGGIGRMAPEIANIVKLLGQAGKAYLKGNTVGARAARAFTDPRRVTAALTSGRFEGELEGQGAYDQALAMGYSVEEAERIANEVARDTTGIVAAFNMVPYGSIFKPKSSLLGVTRPTKGLLPKVGTFGKVVGAEGSEEFLQSLDQQYRLGQDIDWQQAADSFIVGSMMGSGHHAAISAANAIANRGKPSEQELWDEAVRINNQLKAAEYSRNKYENLHGEEIARQSLTDAQREYDARLRDWARDKTGNVMSDEVYNLIVQSAQRHGVPVEHALAQAFAESKGVQDVVSPAGAIGVMQLMPETAAGLGVDPHNLEQNIDAGVRYLKQRYEKTGDWTLAHAAYNAGLDAVQRAGGVPNYSETQDYVAKINGYLSDAGVFQDEQSQRRALFGVENYNMPTQSSSIDNQVANLKDGWQTVIPQIGGVLKEKFGINAEISSAARTEAHNAEVGGVPTSHHIIREGGGDALDIVFDRETSQEEQNAIAEYFRNTGLFSEILYHDVGSGAHLHLGGLKTENIGVQSRADQLYSQRLNEGWQREQKENQREKTPEAEKPLFDINAQDPTTQKLIEQFVYGQIVQADAAKDTGTVNFFAGMFGSGGVFQNTKENLAAIQERYGDKFTNFIQGNQSSTPQEQQTTTPVTPVPAPTQADNAPLRNPVLVAGENYLEQLLAKGGMSDTGGVVALRLQEALNKGNVTEVENILKQNNVPIPTTTPQQQTQPAQPQQDPVQNNSSPENILAQPDKATQKLIARAKKPIATGKNKKAKSTRANQGIALVQLAQMSGIPLTNDEVTKLQNGDPITLTKIQAQLKQAGVFEAKATGQTQGNSNLKTNSNAPQSNEMIETRSDSGVITFTPQSVINSLEYRAKQIIKKNSDEHKKNVLQERADIEANDELEEESTAVYSPEENSEASEEEDSSEPLVSDLAGLVSRTRNKKAQGVQPQQNVAQADTAWRKKQSKELALLTLRQAEKKKKQNEPRPTPEENAKKILSDESDNQEYEEAQQAVQAIEDAINNGNLYQARVVIEKNGAPKNVLEGTTSVPQQETQQTVDEREKAQETYDNIVGKIRQEQNRQLDAGNIKTAQAIEDALNKGDFGKFTKILTNAEIQELQSAAKTLFGSSDVEKQAEVKKQVSADAVRRTVANEQAAQAQETNQLKAQEKSQEAGLQAQTALAQTTRSALQNESEAQETREQVETVKENSSPEPVTKQNIAQNQSAAQKLPSREKTQPVEEKTPPEEISTVAEESQQPTGKNAGKYGRTRNAESDSDVKYPVQYKVVEASDLSTSDFIDSGGVFKNPNYKGIQPRDRSRIALQQKVTKMVNQFDPEKALDMALSINQGAAVITNDGTVQNGNGRVMALKEVYKQGKGEAYKKALAEQAELFGLNADDISKMNQPVLVREFTNDLSEEQKYDIADTTEGGSGVSASERAKSDTRKLIGKIFVDVPADKTLSFRENPLSMATRDLLTNVLNAIESTDKISEYTTKNGSINQAGVTRAMQAVTAAAYPNDRIITRMSESLDNDIRTVSNALVGAAPNVLRTKIGMGNGNFRKYDLNPITDAAEKFAALKAQGKKKSDFQKEISLLGDISDEAKEIVSFLYDNNRSEKKITALLNGIVQGIRKQGDPHQGSLFGETEPAPLMDIIKQAEQDAVNQEQSTLFDMGNAKTPLTEKEVDNIIKNHLVADKDLTPQQKLIKSFAEKLGVKVEFFDDSHLPEDKRPSGFYRGNTSYFNVNTQKSLDKVFWHETLHWLKANNAELYQQLVDAAGITDAQREAYAEEHNRKDLTDEELNEEIIADMFHDTAKRNGLMQNIAGENRSLIERVVQWLKDTMNKFIDHFRNPDGKLTTKQAQALADAFGKNAASWVDENGNKIFRYNRRTHNVEAIGNIVPLGTKKDTVTVTGDEFGEYGDLKELRKKAIQYYKDNLQGTSVFNKNLGRIDLDENGLVEFTAAGRKKVESTSAQEQKLLLVKHLPQLIRSATEIQKSEALKERHKDDLFYYMKNHAEIDGKQVPVHITLVKHNTGRIQFYNHAIEMENAPVNSAEPVSSKEALGFPPVGALSDKNISQGREDSKTKFSFGANDNSSESLFRKARNRFSSWWNGKPDKNRNAEITDLLHRITGYKVDFGNVKDGDQTVIDDIHKFIRTKHAYEWEKLLPQIGGKIAKTLKLNPTQEMSNYIADWVITGAPNNTSAEAKAFEKAMKDDPFTQSLMLKLRETFQDYHDMSAQDKIGSTLVSRLKGKSWREVRKILWRDKEEEFTDDLHPILRQFNEMIAKAEKTNPKLAKLLKENIDVYKKMRLLRGAGGLGKLMVEGDAQNIDKIRSTLQELYPRLNFDKLVSLNMIVDMAGGAEHFEGLMKYAVAKLDKEIHEKARANPDGDYRPQFSESVDDEVIQKGEKQYADAHRALVTYSHILATISWDAGLITDGQYSKMIKGWKNYIPMQRVFDENDLHNDDFKFADSLKPKTGSKRNTYDIWESLTQNTYETFSRAERNRAKQQLAFYARIGEFGDIIQEVETSNPGLDVIRYRENGKMKYLKVFDPAVARAVGNIYHPADTSWLMKALKATSSFMRARYTTGNLGFALGNIPRDMQDAYVHARHVDGNPFVALLEMFRTLKNNFSPTRMWREKNLVAQDDDWVEFHALGGSQSSFVSEDINQLQRSMDKLQRKTWWDIIKERKIFGAIEAIQAISEQTEYFTRLNTYKRTKAELAKQRGENATLADKQLAALDARDASTDFAKAGSSVRLVNKAVLFANAQVQDLAKWGVVGRDLVKGGEARKDAMRKIFRTILFTGIASLAQAALLALSGDDWRDKYRKLLDWEKETYWYIGGVGDTGFRIPKGQDISTRMLSALMDETADKWLHDDPVSTKRLFKILKDALPSIVPTLLEPYLEARDNYSSFRDAPIVPTGELTRVEWEQYGKETSSFAKWFGSKVGNTFMNEYFISASPRKIDHMIQGYLGTFGSTLFRIPDTFTRGWRLNNYPFISRFVFDASRNSKVVKEYYEVFNKQAALRRAYETDRKYNRNAEKPDGYDPKLYKNLESVSQRLRKLSKLELEALKNPNIDWDTKNERLRKLEKEREQLCEKAMERAR